MMETVVLTDKEFERQLYDSIDREVVRVREIKKALHKIYYTENRQNFLDYQKNYNVVNREMISIRDKEHYLRIKNTETEEEREVRLKKGKSYRDKYKEKLRLKLYRLKKRRINDKKYRESHREILRLRDKKYKKENRIEINRRAKERNQRKKEQTNV